MNSSEFIAAVNKMIRALDGNVSALILLAALWDWTKHDADSDGWIFKTMEDIEAETGLSRTRQMNGRLKLRQLGILEERQLRLEHKLLYRIDVPSIDEWLSTQMR